MLKKNKRMLKFNEINKLNEANLVLRHFVDLSAQLLPFLEQLERKKKLSIDEASYKMKIKTVFENYNFDTKTSQVLINSNVLELIQSSFNKIINSASAENSRTHKRTLRKFLFEHQRLNESWNLIESN